MLQHSPTTGIPRQRANFWRLHHRLALVLACLAGAADTERRRHAPAGRHLRVPLWAPPRALHRLAGGGAAAPTLSLPVRDAASGARSSMQFSARAAEGGELQEVEAAWTGTELSAPVEGADDLVFLAASILGCDTRRSVLWLAPTSRSARTARGRFGAESQHGALSHSGARRLRAETAASLWQQLLSASQAEMALVVTDVDASEPVLDDAPGEAGTCVVLPRASEPTIREADLSVGVPAHGHGHAAVARQGDAGTGAGGSKDEGGCDGGRRHGGTAPASFRRQVDRADADLGREAGALSPARSAAAPQEHEHAHAGQRVPRPSAPPPAAAAAVAAADRVRLQVESAESGAREEFVLRPQLCSLPARQPPGSSPAENTEKTPGANKDAGAPAWVLDCVWERGRARFNVSRCADLSLYVARVMRLPPEQYRLFRPGRDGRLGSAGGGGGGGGGGASSLRPIPQTLSPQALWQVLMEILQGAGRRKG